MTRKINLNLINKHWTHLWITKMLLKILRKLFRTMVRDRSKIEKIYTEIKYKIHPDQDQKADQILIQIQKKKRFQEKNLEFSMMININNCLKKNQAQIKKKLKNKLLRKSSKYLIKKMHLTKMTLKNELKKLEKILIY